MSFLKRRGKKASPSEAIESKLESRAGRTGVPEVEIPEGCKGDAQIITEQGALQARKFGQVKVFFSCPAQNNGELINIYEMGKYSMEKVTKRQLEQIASAGAISVKARCWNCSLGPFTNAPDDLSQLERRPEGN